MSDQNTLHPKTYLEIEEAAALMNLSVGEIRARAASDRIPAIKIGRGKKRIHYMIHRKALEGVE